MEPVDEAFGPDGRPRPHYAEVLAALAGHDLAALAADLRSLAAAEGVRYGAGEAAHPLVVDPVPRIIAAEEWAGVEAGVRQRVRALEAFAADALGPRATVRDGVVPADLLEGSPHLPPRLRALPPPPVLVGAAGLDLVRGPDGRLAVLEDNARTPTLMAYAVWARRVVRARLPVGPDPRPLAEPLRELLAAALRAAAPEHEDPHVVVLLDATTDSGWEARALARLLGAATVRLEDLAIRGDRLVVREDGRAVDVVYRRTPEDRLEDPAGELTPLGAALVPALAAGTLRVLNAFGSGIADDKRTFAHVPALIRHLLGEEPLLPSVPAYDLADPGHRAAALGRMDELVFKPHDGAGGHGVVLGPRASAGELRALREAIAERPHGWIAQELVVFSTHPTVVDGSLAPRHADLRPFAFAAQGGEGYAVWPGAMTRFALEAGELVVNAAQGGGAKDTWVMP